MDFLNKLDITIEKNNSLVCIGLDPSLEKLPGKFKGGQNPLFEFNKYIIDTTHASVCAYKPNTAFYEAFGSDGIRQLKETCDYIKENHPDIPVILDAKRGDIGSTNNGYVEFAFEYLSCDAITLHPYMGRSSLEPFLARSDKGCIVLCQTSNEGADEFQALDINGEKLYKKIAKAVAEEWNKNNNCLLVAGATYPEELKEIRQVVGEGMSLLVPGIGTQGADIEAVLESGLNSEGKGLIINSSRAVIYADDPGKQASQLKADINQYR